MKLLLLVVFAFFLRLGNVALAFMDLPVKTGLKCLPLPLSLPLKC